MTYEANTITTVHDSDAEYSIVEERLNWISLGLSLILAIIGLVYLIIATQIHLAIRNSIVYDVTLSTMFLTSTIYHGISHLKAKQFFKLLDHSAIYLLIAGTYTPFVILSIGGWLGWTALAVIWSIALFGVLFKCFTGTRYPKISVSTYLVMGWLAVFMAYPFYLALPTLGLKLLVAGGLCFSFGVLFYVAKETRFAHAIWHLFVIAGCACHYFAVYFFVL